MSLNRYARRRDANERTIIDTLRAHGAVVYQLDSPADLLVGYRQRWFLPYSRRTGLHLEDLHAQGGRAVEYYMGPADNPGVEVNIAFGGRKLRDAGRSNRTRFVRWISRFNVRNTGLVRPSRMA
ncbi:MAG: hypothetical protein HGA26_02825, partial [Chlorobiaceae bacterium]|nr:hypothetical protein [Chlorobiaceae bacterium]